MLLCPSPNNIGSTQLLTNRGSRLIWIFMEFEQLHHKKHDFEKFFSIKCGQILSVISTICHRDWIFHQKFILEYFFEKYHTVSFSCNRIDRLNWSEMRFFCFLFAFLALIVIFGCTAADQQSFDPENIESIYETEPEFETPMPKRIKRVRHRRGRVGDY